MTRLKINVPNPCVQTWKEMVPTHNGKMCSNCAKEVIDFTRFSNDQLKAWFDMTSAERVCGTFKPSQLATFNQAFVKKKYWHSFSKSVLVTTCLAFFMNSKTNAESNLLQQQIVIQVNDHIGDNLQQKSEKSVSDSLMITGIVQAKDDHSPLAGVWVGIKNGTKSVVTNAKGEFSISIPSAKNIDLIFKYIGFETLTKRIDRSGQHPLQINMETDAYVMGEVVIVNPLTSTKEKINNRPLVTSKIVLKEPLFTKNKVLAIKPSLAKRCWFFLKDLL